MDRHQQSAIESKQQTNPNRIKSRFERGHMAVIGAALTIAALAGCSTNAEAQSPKPVVTHSAEATPSEAPSPAPSETEKAPQVELGPITPEMSPEEQANQIEAIRNAWLFHGVATQEEVQASMNESTELNLGVDEYDAFKTREAQEKYAPLLFGENWEEDLQQEELMLSGASTFFNLLNDNYLKNLTNGLARYGEGEVPSMKTEISNVTDKVSDTLDEGEHGLLYDADFEYVNATNADPTVEIRLGFNLKEQPDGTLKIVGMAERPQSETE